MQVCFGAAPLKKYSIRTVRNAAARGKCIELLSAPDFRSGTLDLRARVLACEKTCTQFKKTENLHVSDFGRKSWRATHRFSSRCIADDLCGGGGCDGGCSGR